jgi:hypothetical protein
MKKPISLSEDERLRFMRSLYAVFYRDENIDKTEGEVLRIFSQVFWVPQNQYRHFSNLSPKLIAHEINLISDVRARIAFLSIIHDVYVKERTAIFGGRDNFPDFYMRLKLMVKLT